VWSPIGNSDRSFMVWAILHLTLVLSIVFSGRQRSW
jgi:hypothetical protein